MTRLLSNILTLDVLAHCAVAAALMALPPHSWAQAIAVSLIFVAREAEQAQAAGDQHVVEALRWKPWRWSQGKLCEWGAPTIVAFGAAGLAAITN